MVDKCIIDGCSAQRPDNGDGLGGCLLGNDHSEPRGNLSNQPDKDRTTFLDDPSLSDEPGRFGHGLCEDPTDDEVVVLACIISFRSTAETKHLYA